MLSLIAGTCVGRTPLLPLRTIADVYGSDPATAVSRLANDSVVRAALEYASPALAASVRYGEPVTEGRTLQALVSYLSRMSTRTTPFGLFAGVAPVADGKTTTLRVTESLRRTYSQFDQGWIDDFLREPEEKRFDSGELRMLLHDSTFLKGRRLARLPDWRTKTDPENVIVQSVKETQVLRYLREFLTEPLCVNDILERLSSRFAYGNDDLRVYLRKLWRAGYLISESAASPNSDAAAARLQLAVQHPTAGPWIENVAAHLRALDALPLGEPHREAHATIQREAPEHSSASTPVMVDLYSPFAGTLGDNVRAEVQTFAELSLRGGRRIQCRALMARFRGCFPGEMRFVPLLEAVDACLGVLSDPDSGVHSDTFPAPPERQLLLDALLQQAAARREFEISLSARDVEALFPPIQDWSAIPKTIELGFSIAAHSIDDINAGEFSLLPGTMLANYFSGATSARFHRMFRIATQHDVRERPGSEWIDAELVYVPREPRDLNVALRRVDAEYEINVGVFSGGVRQRLLLEDLVVGLDPRTNRFIVLSKSLSKRVRVVETTSVNPRRAAPPVARFLSEIGRAGNVYPQRFAWSASDDFAYRPRLRYGRIVLRLATWKFPKRSLEQSGLSELSRTAVVPLPQYAALVDRDRRLVIDTRSELGERLVHDHVRRLASDIVTFEESILSLPHGWLQGDHGSYHAEFTVGIQAQSPPKAAAQTLAFGEADLAAWASRLRDDWLYVRVWESTHRFEFLLRTALEPVIAFAREHGIAFFFVRYDVPEPHLRLRFNVEPDSEPYAHLVRLMRSLQTTHGIRRLSFDQYEPEVERYGGDAALRQWEKIFAVSSTLALNALAEPSADERIRACARDLASLVVALIPVDQRAGVIATLRPPPGDRRLDAAQRTALRTIRAEWPRSLLATEWKALELDATLDILSRAQRPVGDIMTSIVHMHANRLGLHGTKERRMVTLLWHVLFGLGKAPEAAGLPSDR